MKKPVLISCPQMMDMAEKIKAIFGDRITWWATQWRSFENSWPDMKAYEAYDLNRRKVLFLASFDTPDDFTRQALFLRSLPFFTGEDVMVSLPYYPTGTKERMVEYGEIATGRGLAALLSEGMPKYVKYEFLVYDIHTKGGIHAFGDHVRPLYRSALKLLLGRILSIPDAAVCLPDEGAWKRFEEERNLFAGMPIIRCSKDKIDDKTQIRIIEGDPKGKHVIVIDDLANTGKTANKTGAVLDAAGAVARSFYATHGVCPNESWRVLAEGGWRHIWFTDSCPHTTLAIKDHPKFEILSVAPLIAEEFTSFMGWD